MDPSKVKFTIIFENDENKNVTIFISPFNNNNLKNACSEIIKKLGISTESIVSLKYKKDNFFITIIDGI
jgi:hypothetical protein